VFTEEALRHLVAQVGPSQVVLGTDHPIPWEEPPVDHVMATTTLSLTQRAAILGGNAARLLLHTKARMVVPVAEDRLAAVQRPLLPSRLPACDFQLFPK
jgi:hypothetical protein